MNPQLRAWLLEGDDLPEDLDLPALLAADPDAAALAAELAEIDDAARQLPALSPPDHLDAAILSAIATPPAALSLQAPLPKPANRPWILGLVASVGALAAAALLTLGLLPAGDTPGNPADWTARGDAGAGPGVDLRIAVKPADPTAQVRRLERGAPYQPGDTLLFRYDAHAAGFIALIRVDQEGAEVVHTQQVEVGEGDLETAAGLVGYELESGETTAVFALLRSDAPIADAALRDALRVGPDAAAVCAAALDIRARCAAETIGEVP